MRWYEIINEEQDFEDHVKNAILDMITPLRGQGISSLTLDQLMDQIKSDPEIQGMDLTPDFVSSLINKIPGFSVHTDSNGQLIVDMEKANNGDQDTSAKKDSDSTKVDNAAMRQATKDL